MFKKVLCLVLSVMVSMSTMLSVIVNADLSTAQSIADSLIIDTTKPINSDIILPTTEVPNATITWETSDKNIITANGKVNTGVIQRNVTLTAVVQHEGDSVTKTFLCTVAQKNIATNGSFETSDFSGWSNGSLYGVYEVISNDSVNAHGGLCYAKISSRQTADDMLRQSITIKNNRTYNYSCWLKKEGVVTNPEWAAMTSETLNTSGIYPDFTGWIQLGDTWKEVSGTKKLVFSATEPESSVMVKFSGLGVGYQTVFFDDLSIIPTYLANRIDITGDSTMSIDSNISKTIAYSATVKNQVGTIEEMPTDVTWSLLQPYDGVSIDNNGNLTVMPTAESGTITVVATAEDYGNVITEEKTVTLVKETDIDDLLQEAGTAIEVSDVTNEGIAEITHDLILPSTGLYDSIISWSSSNETIISSQGKVAEVTIPTEVRLTATIEIVGEQKTKIFDFVVIPVLKNIVKNFGFESGNTTSWSCDGGTLAPDQTNKRTGNYCGRLSNRTASWMGIQQNITIENNVPYEYSMWLKLPQGTPSADFKLYTPAIGYTGIHATITDNWTQLKGVFTYNGTTGGTTVTKLMAMESAGVKTATLYMDDCSVTKLCADTIIDKTRFYDEGTLMLENPIQGNINANTFITAGNNGFQGVFVIAVYNQMNELSNLSIINQNMIPYERKNVIENIYCAGSTYKVKAMIWNNIDNMLPLKQSYILE